MALHWQWDEKCGEATIRQKESDGGETEYTVSLYTGNACLIMLYEREENGQEVYSLWSFWADKQHMKNCLGLNKKEGFTSNQYAGPFQRITKIRLNKAKCRYFKDIVPALAQAFDELTIEIFTEE